MEQCEDMFPTQQIFSHISYKENQKRRKKISKKKRKRRRRKRKKKIPGGLPNYQEVTSCMLSFVMLIGKITEI